MYYLGLATETTANSLIGCKAAKSIDIPKLKIIAQVFKYPKNLVVDIPLDIIVNYKSIMSYISAG
jgi:hypothetical protein